MTGDLVRWAPGTTAGGTATVLATYQAYAGETYAPSLFAGPPWSLAADAAGVLYVLHKKTLSKVANGTVQVLAGPSQFVAPPYAARLVPITADAAGNVYVGDGEVIVRVSPGGAVAAVAGQRGMIGLRTGALPGSLGVLSSLAAGRDGLLHMMSADDVVTVQLP